MGVGTQTPQEATVRRNPYRLAEKVTNWTIGILVTAVVVIALGTLAAREWGWWALLLLIAIPAGMFVLALVAGITQHVTWKIERAWERRKYQWDNNHD